MSFKIVQTKERGAKFPLLTIVPSAWEKDGTLYWPPAKKKFIAFKKIRDGNSRPEADWVPQPCSKKRNMFLTYEAADLELTAMQSISDSEASHFELPIITKENISENIETGHGLKRKIAQNRTEIGRVPQEDFNFLAEECKKARELILSESVDDDILLEENVEEYSCEINQNEQIPIENTLNTLLENQMRIMEQLANQETMIQLICQQLCNEKPAVPIREVSDAICDNASPDPLPIDSLQKLEQLEMELRDEIYMDKLIKSKSHICGTDGKMNGLNCSYLLIDRFFKREFLLQFSWSGGSRRQEGKNAFKKYTNIISLFYKIISKADCQYTEMDCEKFMKSIIKNARRRFELSGTGKRASSGKKRPQNLNYKKTNENHKENSVPDEQTQGDQSESIINETDNEESEHDELTDFSAS